MEPPGLPHGAGQSRRRLTRPTPEIPTARAAGRDRSITRPPMNGPRSVMRTVTDRPVNWFVTRTRVPSG